MFKCKLQQYVAKLFYKLMLTTTTIFTNKSLVSKIERSFPFFSQGQPSNTELDPKSNSLNTEVLDTITA